MEMELVKQFTSFCRETLASSMNFDSRSAESANVAKANRETDSLEVTETQNFIFVFAELAFLVPQLNTAFEFEPYCLVLSSINV